MSLDRCAKCGDIADTGVDCNFYDFTYRINGMGGHCSNCRDEMYERMTPFQQEQHEKRIYG